MTSTSYITEVSTADLDDDGDEELILRDALRY